MIFDYRKLKRRITEKFDSQKEFAKVFGISQNSLSKKLTNKTQFSSGDIEKMCNLLDLREYEIGDYFFKKRV